MSATGTTTSPKIAAGLLTIGVHEWLQVFVLGDDVGDLPDRQVSVFVLLDMKHKTEDQTRDVIRLFWFITCIFQVIEAETF